MLTFVNNLFAVASEELIQIGTPTFNWHLTFDNFNTILALGVINLLSKFEKWITWEQFRLG